MATIKAGTYVFVESPAKPSSATTVAINFKMHYLTANNTYANVTVDGTHIDLLTSFGGQVYLYPITESGDKGVPSNFYSRNNNTWHCLGLDAKSYTATDTTKLRTIIIETDQTVTDDFYTWFTANTALQPKLSIDLTTLPGWANLSSGNHTIKIKAKGTGYKESELSAGVTVSKAASTVTLEAGTYKWNDSVTLADISQDLEFTSNNTSYHIIEANESRAVITYTDSYMAAVYNNGAWANTAYQTITLDTDQQVSPEFYKWAITDGNLVKQTTAYKVTLSLDGDPRYIPTPIDIYQCDDDKGTNKELVTTITSSADNNKVITVTKAYLYYLGDYGGYTKVDGDMTYYITWDSCLTGDTLVTMFDKSEKRLDEIEFGDKVLSVDFDMKQHIVSEVVYTDKNMNKQHTEYDLWKFSDGTEIKTVHKHEFYNLESKRMKYMDEWKIGEHTLKVDGTHPVLVEHKTIKEDVKHYKITLDGNTAYFANGLLTGDRHCPKNKEL